MRGAEHFDSVTRDFSILSPTRSSLALISDYGLTLCLAVLGVVTSGTVFTVCIVILIARQQHAIAVLIHEGVHHRLYRNRAVNDFILRWFLAAPLGVSAAGYAETHLGHHAATMTEEDPDLEFLQDFPMSRSSFALRVLLDFSGVVYLGLLLHYWRYAAKNKKPLSCIARGTPPIVTNLGILAAFSYWASPSAYLIYWLLPLFCVLPFFLHVRGICEHGGHIADPDPTRCTWTVINAVQTFFFAPHNINYHMEHHAFPAVPQYNLPKLHRHLRANGWLPEENIKRGYLEIIRGRLLAP